MVVENFGSEVLGKYVDSYLIVSGSFKSTQVNNMTGTVASQLIWYPLLYIRDENEFELHLKNYLF